MIRPANLSHFITRFTLISVDKIIKIRFSCLMRDKIDVKYILHSFKGFTQFYRYDCIWAFTVIAADRLYVVRLSSSANRKSNRYVYYSIFTWIWAAILVGPICQKVDLIPITEDSNQCTFIFTSLITSSKYSLVRISN